MNYFQKIYLGLEEKYKLKPLRDVILFVFITLSIHILFKIWAVKFDYFIFGWQVLPPGFHNYFVDLLFNSSKWVMENLFIIPINASDHSFCIDPSPLGDKCAFTMNVVQSCSGVKQFIQFALLMIIFPGPWKHKLWYIPMGLILVYLTNVLRIVGLAELVRYFPNSFHWMHDYAFRPLFYVVIFSLWVIWVEYFKNKKKFRWNLDKFKSIFTKKAAKPENQ